MAINLCESFRAMFYTPFYLPFSLGTYEAEGVDITLSTSPSLNTVAEQLRDGIADVYWGGPMRIMVMRDKNREPEILGFHLVFPSFSLAFLRFPWQNLRKIQTLGEIYTFLIILRSRKKCSQ